MNLEPGVIRIAGVVRESIVDGPGIRYVVFAQGCPHRCEGCHNEGTIDFSGGKLTETEKILADIEKDPLISGVTFSGGEPFCQAEEFSRLALRLKEKGMNIMTYSGYTYEELLRLSARDEYIKTLLDNTDILVDGPFILKKRDLELQFKGSTNQRYIDMNATRAQRRLVCLENL